MKIQFLGTSHGVPERDRYCTSVLIESAGKHYLIDAGAPIADLLTREGVAFADISAIFLTHLHSDHINGLIPFLDLANWYYKTSDPLIYTPSLDLKAAMENWMFMLNGKPCKAYRYIEIMPGEIYADEAIRVTAIPTEHHIADEENYKRRSYAFAVEEIASGKRVLFTGDLSYDMHDFPESAFTEGYTCIVTEGAHFRLDVHAQRLAQCRTEQMIIAHFYHRSNPPERVEALRAALSVPMTVAEDGQTFVI